MRRVARIAAWICLGMCPLCAAAQGIASNASPESRLGYSSPVGPPSGPAENRPSETVSAGFHSGGVLPAVFDAPAGEPAGPAGPTTSGDLLQPGPPPTREPAAAQTEVRATQQFSLPLPPPGSDQGADGAATGEYRGGITSTLTVVGSLAIVLGLFLLLAWVLRRASPAAMTALPPEVVEVLGQLQLPGRQQVQLVRCGTKLLLVSVTPAGAETLTEITDPEEVQRLAGLCQQARPGSSTTTFRQVFGQLARESSVLGLLGSSREGARSVDADSQAEAYREGRHG